MTMIIDKIGKYYLGNGGIGDFLIFLSTFYDDIDSANVIFLANNPNSIIELCNMFPKIKNWLILHNDFSLLKEIYYHPNCVGTGILPKDLNYNNWYKVDIFKEFGVKQFPEFINIFPPKKINSEKKQIFIQSQGSSIDGSGKKRIITDCIKEQIKKVYKQDIFEYVNCSEYPYKNYSLSYIFSLIRGSDIVLSVDSFAKTVSAMSRIKTIVYENIYSKDYLAHFKNNIDYGHYVFLFPWNYIELRTQFNAHQIISH